MAKKLDHPKFARAVIGAFVVYGLAGAVLVFVPDLYIHTIGSGLPGHKKALIIALTVFVGSILLYIPGAVYFWKHRDEYWKDE